MRASLRRRFPVRDRYPLVALAAAFFVLSVWYARATPLWHHPDEAAHFRYVEELARTGELPVLRTDADNEENHQPPLYYAMNALAYRATGSVRALQLLSALLSMLNVFALYLFARAVAGGRRFLLWGTVLLGAFLPQQLFLSSAVNNDVLADLLGTVTATATVAAFRAPLTLPRFAWSGLLVAADLLTKTTLWPLALALTVTLAVRAARGRRPADYLVLHAVPVIALAGWWFLRNLLLYGEPTGVAQTARLWLDQTPLDVRAPGEVRRWLTILFKSFWGYFGWMSAPLVLPWSATLPYRALTSATLFAVLGYAAMPRALLSWVRERRAALAYAALAVAATFLGVFRYSLVHFQAQGRYLFVVLGPIAFLFVLGLDGWRERMPARYRTAYVALLAAALLALTATGIWTMRYRFITLFG